MPVEAIVVLGCRVGPGGRLRGAALRRVERAARAFADEAPRLVFVAGGRRWSGACEAAAMGEALIARGVPRTVVHLECRSLTTRENARNVTRLLAEHGIAEVGVITCDWHAPRARRAFERRGVRCVTIAAASPPVGLGRALLRAAKERGSALLDALAHRSSSPETRRDS